MGRQNERTGPLEWECLRGLFLSFGRGNLGTLSPLVERICSPIFSAKVDWTLVTLKRHVITPDMALSRAF